MKATAAIVETAFAQHRDRVRAAYSAYRESEVQVEKADKRAADAQRIAENARTAREQHRLDVGRALQAAHDAMGIKQGDRSGRWAKFLGEEGIPLETARRWMAEVGSFEAATSPTFEIGGSEIPAAADRDERPDPPRAPLHKVLDMQLLLGTWQDMLGDIGMVDVLISDPPFSPRVHASAPTRNDDVDAEGLAPSYAPWTRDDVDAFVAHWSPRVRGWMHCLCDDEMIPWYRAAYERAGRVAFAPVVCVIRGMSVRTRGDGPSSEAIYAMVARPKGAEFARWGTLPGAYVGNRELGAKSGRGKPRWLTDAFVRDYSRVGDLVCDPLAGYGGTLISALLQGRRAIGAEQDEEAVNEAFARASASQGLNTNEEP